MLPLGTAAPDFKLPDTDGKTVSLAGFTATSVGGMDQDLFARWLAFGMLSSHSRCHGIAPKEPWLYGTNFMDEFREIDGLKYKLMPYVYAQAKDSSEHGLPMVRALFVEFPDDPGAWLVDDEYLYGSSLLVAPLLHENETSRDVYLPPGKWIDYQTGKNYSGGWQKIEAGKIPEIILVRDGTVIPHIALAQSTLQMDWSKIELVVFAKDAMTAKGSIFLPGDSELHELTLTLWNNHADAKGTSFEPYSTGRASNGTFKLASDPSAGKVTWKIQANSDK